MKATVDSAALRGLLPGTAAVPAGAIHPPAAVATPTAPDRPPEHDAARRFAELLRERRSDAAPPAVAAPAAPMPTEAVAAADAPDSCDSAANEAPTAAPRGAQQAKPRAPASGRAPAKTVVEDHAAAERAIDDGDAREDEIAAAGVATVATADERTATTLALLAAQATRDGAPGHCAARAAADGDGDGRVADAAQPVAANSRDPRGRARGLAAQNASDDVRALARAADTPLQHAGEQAPFASALGETLRAFAPADRAHASRAEAPLAAPVTGGAVVDASAPRDAAAPATTLALATAIDGPDFAAALGVQVSVLARDGVQHAELHLHPVETGPVSIRIEVDGTNARVDFGADFVATREAIERGLPELASALRDAGLTLAGGSVSQHAGSRPRGDDDASETARTRTVAAAAAAAPAPARPSMRRLAVGAIDLYA